MSCILQLLPQAFGLAHPISQLVRFRPPNRDASLKNLYFVGASTSPGNGVPLVLTGARMLSQRILAENKENTQNGKKHYC